ncbi:hypothetical protein [Dokdonella soli]|uniref:Uncharacterized protein n=1 Tax=Dokdonella soli TaxID=529810 RepID=A0ABN1IDT2_9GAMM
MSTVAKSQHDLFARELFNHYLSESLWFEVCGWRHLAAHWARIANRALQ